LEALERRTDKRPKNNGNDYRRERRQRARRIRP